MSFIRRLLKSISGRPDFDAEEIADDLFGGKAEKRRTKEREETDRIIEKTLQNRDVQNLIREIGITEGHIRDVYRRLMLHGDKKTAESAISSVELLRWYYFNGGKDKVLSFEQAVQLFTFAKSGRL